MSLAKFLLSAVFLASAGRGHARVLSERAASNITSTCNSISAAVPDPSQVSFPGSSQYTADNAHMYSSSSAASACSVEPSSAEDVSAILRILGSTRTPFAVKGGGHATNPGFSSTTGVEIAMSRLKEISINSTAGTVDLGPGLIWDEVYETLGPAGFNVVGGRIPTIGIAGWTLGGGFSFLSNQYGLGVDNVVAFDLVLPNGTITTVTSRDEDLWFGLRGGLNNFGIVTKFTVKLHPLGQIWGGVLSFAPNQTDVVNDALVKYQQKTDPKSALLGSVVNTPEGAATVIIMYYNAPTPPDGLFDEFLAIPTNQSDVSTRSFVDLYSHLASGNAPQGFRGYYSGVPVTNYSKAVLDAIDNQTTFWSAKLGALDNTTLFNAAIEPFDSGLFSHGSDSAFPPDRSQAILPTCLTIAYSNASLDAVMAQALREFTDAVQAVAVAEGQNVSQAAPYTNYALFDTPIEIVYGQNLPRLRTIKNTIDPKNVMGLAGGWKL
ncbi:FAD dependent oxidoreductase [Gloeopeniophorella convolvens]|nr:FAD dependent oxidoreductase [Gloeopeniophorella convolvens]